ncbi:DUF2723 domain-containing protein [Tichowtungia aerotolerans]|uniref:DUF2723 domain-containing protein n=1 Tax=Tichowtungia aerotolerans TaxID=2697043 RepID=A0A6P1M2A1_9BACT|nr:DUF2723 domain-containing protein [Tichowtungia aerotolerans]QHI67957.1 DUF2723 domain-containing protein [Tichowtungia aerotolerans]
MNKKPFFRLSDWIAFGVTFVISLTVYTLTLQPTVGLEDSGELIVASDYLGVPHPPGYPIWSLLTWAFQWVFHKVTYHGYPNPAWAVNFFSAFTGAAACAVLALLVSRSGMDFLRNLKKETEVLGEKTESLFCCVAGIAAGLLLAFSQGLWSQSVIAEVYAPNILFQTAVLLFLYRWMCEPDNPRPLFLMAFVFGLGLTNHQTLLFMGAAIGVGVLVRNLKLARDFIIVGLFYVLMLIINKFGPEAWAWNRGWDHASFWVWSVYAVMIPVLGLFLPNGKTVCATYLLMLLGLSFYLYMPFSSDQNPPINWGYPRTWEGLMHAITRGQYEKVTLANVFSTTFLLQVGAYLRDLRAQFLGPIAALAILPFFAVRWLGKKNNFWLLTTAAAFVGVGILFIILQNPKIDLQTLFIARVQYIQSHAVYAIWIGYGLLLLMGGLDTLLSVIARKLFSEDGSRSNVDSVLRIITLLGVAMVFLLPFSLVAKNYFSRQQEKVVGGSEQNGHDFGWQFGNWQLRGVEGIKEDLWYYCGRDQEKFDEEWEKYPNPDYPPPMGTNAIFFGGTDPGRFVPTYMIYCPQVRSDVYLITQNALADNTYMAVMRDLYGDQIWIPSQQDSNHAFQEYVQGVQSGRINAGADVKTADGRVQVQGVAGVMQINGILCRQIFDHNQYITEEKTDESTRQSGAAVVPADPVGPDGKLRQRDFYVEESYVIPWMYPYLTPHGLIMKINNKPTPITREMIKNDQEFWGWYVDRLVNDRKFQRDIVARKSFSKLRSAIAGLYSARGHIQEAELAFRQAVALYPLSPEAVFRLADLYMRLKRFDEAREVIETFAAQDKHHDRTGAFLDQIDQVKTMSARKDELEQTIKDAKGASLDISQAFELISLYSALQEQAELRSMVNRVLSAQLPPQIKLQLAQQLAQMRRFDIAEVALVKYLAAKPDDTRIWIELAVVRMTLGHIPQALSALETAVEKGGDSARNQISKDARFRPLYSNPQFRSLVPAQAPKKTMQFNNLF